VIFFSFSQPLSVLVSLLPAPQNSSVPAGTPPCGYNRATWAPCIPSPPSLVAPCLFPGRGSSRFRYGRVSFPKSTPPAPKSIPFLPVTASVVSPQGSSPRQRAAGELREEPLALSPPGRERCPVLPPPRAPSDFNLFYSLLLPARGPEGAGRGGGRIPCPWGTLNGRSWPHCFS